MTRRRISDLVSDVANGEDACASDYSSGTARKAEANVPSRSVSGLMNNVANGRKGCVFLISQAATAIKLSK
jgi:hypothetical protein